MKPPTSRSTLFPYTTLFRSAVGVRGCLCGRSQEQGAEDGAAQDRAEPGERAGHGGPFRRKIENVLFLRVGGLGVCPRSEEHTSELQSRLHLVCRLLLEKNKN